MATPQDLLLSLARAYSLAEIHFSGDPELNEGLEAVRKAQESAGWTVVRVRPEGLTVRGQRIADDHGEIQAFRDVLDSAGIQELRLQDVLSLGALEDFLRRLHPSYSDEETAPFLRFRGLEPVMGLSFRPRDGAASGMAGSIQGLFQHREMMPQEDEVESGPEVLAEEISGGETEVEPAPFVEVEEREVLYEYEDLGSGVEEDIAAVEPEEGVPAFEPEETATAVEPEEGVPAFEPEETPAAVEPEEGVPAFEPEETPTAVEPEEGVPAFEPAEEAAVSDLDEDTGVSAFDQVVVSKGGAEVGRLEVRPAEAEPLEMEPAEAEPLEMEPAEVEPLEMEPAIPVLDEPKPVGIPELEEAPEPVETHELGRAEVREAEEALDDAPSEPPTSPHEMTGSELEDEIRGFLEGSGPARAERAERIREQANRLLDGRERLAVLDLVVTLSECAGEDPPDPEVLELVEDLVTPGVAGLFLSRLGSERDEEERARLTELTPRLGPEVAEALVEVVGEARDRRQRRTFLDAMVTLGPAGIEMAARMVEDARWYVVRNGVTVLGEIAGEDAVLHLTATLGNADPRVRKESVMALAKVGGEDATLLILGMLDDSDPDVRAATCRALGVLQVGRAVRPLLGILDGDSNVDVQVECLQALGQIGDPGAVPHIQKKAVGGFLRRPPQEVRIAAYRGLAGIRTPHARELLRKAINDSDPRVRAVVKTLLLSR